MTAKLLDRMGRVIRRRDVDAPQAVAAQQVFQRTGDALALAAFIAMEQHRKCHSDTPRHTRLMRRFKTA